MKKILFGIFAHPDDEGFGPSGTLYKLVHSGTDVHLVLITNGENGNNPDEETNLGAVRLKEWQKSGELIGAQSSLALHYPDGGLCNNLYLEIAGKILVFINKTIKKYDEPVEIDFMTFDRSGLSGHLDHIAVSFITTYIYCKIRQKPMEGASVGKLKYFCLPSSEVLKSNTDWIFMPCGRSENEIDETVDYSDVIEQKLAIMKAHYSQRDDMQAVLKMNNQNYTDYFCYCKD